MAKQPNQDNDRRSHLVEYVCTDTKLTGDRLDALAFLEAWENRALQTDEEDRNRLVKQVMERYGGEFGTDFESISNGIHDHIASHKECSDIFYALKSIAHERVYYIFHPKGKRGR